MEAVTSLIEEFDAETLLEQLYAVDPDFVFASGFERALIGYAQIFKRVVALYDRAKCLEILIERDGLSYERASEYVDTRVIGAYIGDRAPAFATLLKNCQPDGK